jgi:DNA-binding transcriptional regulator YdaS (Cro superfamily)
MSEIEALKKAISRVDGQENLGLLMVPPVKQQAISRWVKQGKCPAERVLQVESATGVSRHLLRPDMYPIENEAAA